MDMLIHLDHPNVLKCFEFIEDENNFYIVSEYILIYIKLFNFLFKINQTTLLINF